MFSSVLLLACASPAQDVRESASESAGQNSQPITAVHLRAVQSEADSAFLHANGGVRSMAVEGLIASPCRGRRPIIQYSDVVTGCLVLQVTVFVPLGSLCDPAGDIYRYTAVAENLEPGRYPLVVRLTIDSRHAAYPSSTRVLLQDTLEVSR